MIPGPFTASQLLRAMIHLLIGCYFFMKFLRQPGTGKKTLFALGCLAMVAFAYDDWVYLRINS